jgi:hypothetical protein
MSVVVFSCVHWNNRINHADFVVHTFEFVINQDINCFLHRVLFWLKHPLHRWLDSLFRYKPNMRICYKDSGKFVIVRQPKIGYFKHDQWTNLMDLMGLTDPILSCHLHRNNRNITTGELILLGVFFSLFLNELNISKWDDADFPNKSSGMCYTDQKGLWIVARMS